MSTSFSFKPIVTDGLILCLDAANTKSYNGILNSWSNLARDNSLNLISTTFSSEFLGGISFNGLNSYASGNFTNPFAETIMVWVKSNTSTWNEFGWISSSRGQNGHIIHPSPGSKDINFYVVDSSSNYSLVGTLTPSDIRVPHFYCLSTNGSNLHKAYLDDELSLTSNTSITRTSSPYSVNWYLGKDDSIDRFGNGVIYLVMRYNRQLTDSEVLQNYNVLKNRFI